MFHRDCTLPQEKCLALYSIAITSEEVVCSTVTVHHHARHVQLCVPLQLRSMCAPPCLYATGASQETCLALCPCTSEDVVCFTLSALVIKTSTSRAADLDSIPTCAVHLFPGRVIAVT